MRQPILVPVPEQGKYRLEYTFFCAVDGKLVCIVPRKFIFDGATIPQIFQGLTYTPFHPHVMTAALVHDYLYTSKEVSRKEADKLFRDLLVLNCVDEGVADLMYNAVRMFGGSHY